jgi:hypothetical protein
MRPPQTQFLMLSWPDFSRGQDNSGGTDRTVFEFGKSYSAPGSDEEDRMWVTDEAEQVTATGFSST